MKEVLIGKTLVRLRRASAGKGQGSEVGPCRSFDEKGMRAYYHRALGRAFRAGSCAISCEAGAGQSERELRSLAKIIAQEIFRLLHEGRRCPAHVCILAPQEKAYGIFFRHGLGYLDYIAHRLKSPFVCVDVIIRTEKGIVAVERSNPPFGLALPGGFVDYGESLEEAAAREAKEETGLSIRNVRQFHTYSRPGRDPRFHTISTVFTASARGIPRAGSDACNIRIIKPAEVKGLAFAFDHRSILLDYLRQK